VRGCCTTCRRETRLRPCPPESGRAAPRARRATGSASALGLRVGRISRLPTIGTAPRR
jgi:hypothetical protein